MPRTPFAPSITPPSSPPTSPHDDDTTNSAQDQSRDEDPALPPTDQPEWLRDGTPFSLLRRAVEHFRSHFRPPITPWDTWDEDERIQEVLGRIEVQVEEQLDLLEEGVPAFVYPNMNTWENVRYSRQ